jgi:predicted NBD/HSP70 family sugar kinase
LSKGTHKKKAAPRGATKAAAAKMLPDGRGHNDNGSKSPSHNARSEKPGLRHAASHGKQSASRTTPRNINRSLIYDLVRTRQPISRAELSRRTGLQRSTVSIIVEELIARRWIVEGEIGQLPRGRHPTMIQLNQQRGVLAMDIHPSEVTIAFADLGGRVISQNVFAFPADPAKAIATVLAGMRKVMKAHQGMQFDGVGICVPGRTDRNLQKFIFAPRLHWPIAELRSKIQRSTGLPVEMDNVANACVLAEVWFGDSDSAHDLVVVNVSEGIGIGIFANGRILRGHRGMAGEFGHVQLFPEPGLLCECGNYGCWETLASNTAALRYFRGAAASSEKDLGFVELVRIALAGDTAAVEALTRMASYLGRGIRMVISGLDPREVVIVGDLSAAWHLMEPVIHGEMKRNSLLSAPLLRRTNHGNSARLRGAVALILSKVSA